MRIGILQTDQVMRRFQDRHGDYPQMFADVLTAAAAGRPLDFLTIDARKQAYPAPTVCDAYVITGSRQSVYDDLPWIPALAGFVETAIDAGRKVLGICFGHQLIAHFFGGETRAASGWAVGAHQSQVVADAPWIDPKLSRYCLISSHKDQVVRIPDGAELVATNAFCPIASFTWKGAVLTFQGHPELKKSYSRDLMNMRRELLGEETYKTGVRSLGTELDAITVGRWMLNFCRA